MIVERPTEQARRSGAAIGEFIRDQREQAQVSLRQLARVAGVSNPYLSQVERGLRKPSAEILQQIAKGLRISAEQLYAHAGFLDFREGNQELVASVLADVDLTERQKQILLDLYTSFRRENAAAAPTAAPAPTTAAPAPIPTTAVPTTAVTAGPSGITGERSRPEGE